MNNPITDSGFYIKEKDGKDIFVHRWAKTAGLAEVGYIGKDGFDNIY